jgi:hypothetical protein
MTRSGAIKVQHDGYAGSIAGEIGRGALARTNRASIRGFVCRRAWALWFTCSRGVVSGFARITAKRSVDCDDGARAGAGDHGASTAARKGATLFRRKFLNALTRQQKWSLGDALDFQRDLQMYEALIARSTSRRRKPFEAANHPFVDRCAFLLDSSFMEKARMAASRALTEVETLSAKVIAEVLQNGASKS